MKPANTTQTQSSDILGLCPQPATTTGATTAASHPAPSALSAPDPASNDIIDLIKRDRAQSLKRKQRSDSFLHRLDDTQLGKVLAWLEDEQNICIVHYRINAPAPEGLGLKVSLSTVRRLRAHVTATHAKGRATEILDTIIDLESNLPPSTQSERIQSAINHFLNQKAFELVRTEPGCPELRDILGTIEKLSALDLKRQKIALEREKMLRHHQRASAPRPANHHRVELKIVPATPNHSAAEPAFEAHPSHNSLPPDQRPPLEIIAPLPEVIL